MHNAPPDIRTAALAGNARGLALAAFATPALIGRLLGVDQMEAERFQRAAIAHWHQLTGDIRRARHG